MTSKTMATLLNTFCLLSIGFILGFTSYKLLDLIYTTQSEPYIDEIFHIPQAQLYCSGRWMEWNPKITTLPGLYIVTLVILKPLELLKLQNICSIYSLRLTNVVATVLNFFILYFTCLFQEKKYKEKQLKVKLLTAFNLATFPPLYFFTFLYYTDVWSMTFVLFMYLCHLSERKILATFGGVMAVMMRQTNVIWVGLCILDEIWNVLTGKKSPRIQNYQYTMTTLRQVASEYLSYSKKSKSICRLVFTILSRTFHFVVVCLIFVLYIFFNGSIVLGDKSAHAATFHPMQNLYALNFMAFFALPFFITEVFEIYKTPPNLFLIVFLVGLAAGLSEGNKLEHPYLLADNRHLAFYIWKKFFGHKIFRRVLIPTYVFSAIVLMRLLKKSCHFMFIVALLFCTFLNLTPQYLFELRYYIAPFIMFRLQFKPSRVVYLETVFYILINVITIYLFLNRSFEWVSEPGVAQRFIW